ncbi:pyridoxal-phosphate dependent enzyme [Sphaerisporangium sp. NPDC051017]|uniref:pyridoxal-phosphate dependent enzyme n=1 Tax=unclassified Sphaerisporangium TaxID=2630420 RepID=UPI0033DEF35B
MTPAPLPAHTHDALAAPAASAVRLLHLPVAGQTVRLRLYLEGENRYGSVKARTAHALLGALEEAGRLCLGGQVIESTSGNLGIALAGLCAERGYRCTLVVDDTTPAFSLSRMADLGAELIHVKAPDAAHAVTARIQTVREFLATNPWAVWTDQYNNPAGPAVHAHTTGPAFLHHGQLAHPDAVVAPVSTGGTLAGVAAYARAHAPEVLVWAVDAVGSAATGRKAAPRPGKLPGFGSGLRSTFLTPRHYDHLAYVTDSDAALACRIIHDCTGIALGGSAGAAVLAAVAAAARSRRVRDIACLCPDGGDRYQATIYAPGPPRLTPCDPVTVPALAALHRLYPERESDR